MACDEIKKCINNKQYELLTRLLGKRLYVRALTTMWFEQDVIALKAYTPDILNKFTENGRLSRLTLLNLIHLYFMKYDLLPGGDKLLPSVRGLLTKNLEQQRLRNKHRQPSDLISKLVQNESLLLQTDSTRLLTDKSVNDGVELLVLFEQLGVQSFISGRFGQICQTLYYIETLKQIPLGAHHPVLDELLKPDVHNAVYADELTMGHAALQVLIDRCHEAPSENWQEFILAVAGDPRIRSGALSYRKWWLPLGTERIEKVQSWLSKEDLKLFLKAVEEYGRSTNNFDLNRMFPARKAFLEGLFELDLVRKTRLMLGRRAQDNVRNILSGEMKTSFAWLGNDLSDKAIIYLDCGDFHLIEGSHSFKIWVYFGLPHPEVISYDRESFSSAELRFKFPNYHDRNNTKICKGFTHTPGSWKYQVLRFLKQNGIHIDEDVLLGSGSKRLSNVASKAVNNPTVKHSPTANRWQTNEEVDAHLANFKNFQKRMSEMQQKRNNKQISRPKVNEFGKTRSSEPQLLIKELPALSKRELEILKYIAEHPSERARFISKALGVDTKDVNIILYGRLQSYFKSNNNFEWSLTDVGKNHYMSIQE